MSKLIKCKSCGKEIASGAKCPSCGKDNRNFFMKHKILAAILVIVVIGVIGTATGHKDTTKVDDSTETSSTAKQDERNFNVGDTAEKADSYRVTVNSLSEYQSSNQYMHAEDGKKYVVANVTVENLSSDKDINVSSIVCFNLLSLEGVKCDTTITDVGSQLDGTVAPGRKLTGNLSYVVPADLTDAELEVKLDVFTGKAIYFKGAISK